MEVAELELRYFYIKLSEANVLNMKSSHRDNDYFRINIVRLNFDSFFFGEISVFISSILLRLILPTTANL